MRKSRRLIALNSNLNLLLSTLHIIFQSLLPNTQKGNLFTYISQCFYMSIQNSSSPNNFSTNLHSPMKVEYPIPKFSQMGHTTNTTN